MIEVGLGLIGTLVQLGIVAGIVYLIVRASKRRSGDGDHEPEAAGTVVRRLFHYGLLFASLMLAATGITGLLFAALESDITIARDAADLAVPLALTIVGVPLFAGLAIWSRRRLETDPQEQSSVAWLLYLTAVLVVSLVVSIIELSLAISWAVGGTAGERPASAAALVWLAIWAAHWWVGLHYPPRDELRAQRLAGSAISLWVGAGFLIGAVGVVIGWVYDEAFRTTIATTIGDDLRDLVPSFVVGTVAWWWYWVRHAVRDRRTVVWHAYALLVGLLPALMIVLTAAGVSIFAVLEWLFGSPESAAADHFAVLPASVAMVGVAAAVLAYHRSLIRRRHATERSEVDRVYDYLVAAVGLVATGVALTMLVSAAIEAVAPAPIAERGSSGVDAFLLAVTLALVGGPLWWYFWSRVQRHAAADAAEANAPTRRLYLFISFGVGGVAAVISLITALATALGDLLDGEMGSGTLYWVRIPLALVVTVGAVAAYHWTVFREDRERAPEEARRRIRSLIVIGGGGAGLGAAIEAATGTRPQMLHRLDQENAEVDPARVMAVIDGTEGDRLVVVVDADGAVDAFPVTSS
jgi:hypothetical protein